jgi:prevent-host-death family protein
MRHVQAAEAKAKFSELLDQVERGETVVITRHGKKIASLVPNELVRRERVQAAIEGLRKIGKEAGRVTVEELLAWRHEGHKY